MPKTVTTDKVLSVIDSVGAALLDAVFVVDREGRFLTFNRVFVTMLPRAVARRLKTRPVADVIKLKRGDKSFDVIGECFDQGQLLRYDEIQAEIPEREGLMTVKTSAMPLYDDGSEDVSAVLVSLRDVTDEGQVQQKYQLMLEEEARERAVLQERIDERTRELMETREELNQMQAELMKYRKGLKL